MRSRLFVLIPGLLFAGVIIADLLPARPSAAAAREEEGVEVSRSAPADGITAREILGWSQEVYAGATSYEDTGIVRTVFDHGWREHDEELTFSTAFVRPERFRFEYREPADGTRYVIGSEGGEVKSWWTLRPEVERHGSLEEPLEAARGVSSRASWYIPSLLLALQGDDGRRASVGDAGNEPTRLPDGTLQGAAAFRVRTRLCGDPVTVWIDKSTYLVRRIEEHYVQEGKDAVEVATTISYHPRLGHAVAAEKLAFAAPAGRTAEAP